MNEIGKFCFILSFDGSTCPSVDGIRQTKPLTHIERIASTGIDRSIAKHSGYANDIERLKGMDKQQGHRVVNARVGIENYLFHQCCLPLTLPYSP